MNPRDPSVIKDEVLGRRASGELGLQPVRGGIAISSNNLPDVPTRADDHPAGMEFFGIEGLGVLVDVHFRAGSAESQGWR
ncbi:MAG TPA: hypothetical protein VF003_17610 [Pseudonocardiaceae bacterium]